MAYSYYTDPRYRYFNHFYKQAGMPPMDPSMMGGGAPPMDPSMMGGGMPPMDPSMMGGGMPPGPPMDPGMVGAPPIDPNAAGLPPAAPPPGDPAAGGGDPAADSGAPAKKNSKQEMDDRLNRIETNQYNTLVMLASLMKQQGAMIPPEALITLPGGNGAGLGDGATPKMVDIGGDSQPPQDQGAAPPDMGGMPPEGPPPMEMPKEGSLRRLLEPRSLRSLLW